MMSVLELFSGPNSHQSRVVSIVLVCPYESRVPSKSVGHSYHRPSVNQRLCINGINYSTTISANITQEQV